METIDRKSYKSIKEDRKYFETKWVYIYSEYHRLWTVGYYDPSGRWQPESDHGTLEEAAQRVHYLNGGQP